MRKQLIILIKVLFDTLYLILLYNSYKVTYLKDRQHRVGADFRYRTPVYPFKT